MPSSGVQVADEVVKKYGKLKNPPKTYLWLKLKLNDDLTQVVMKGEQEKDEGFDMEKIEEEFQGQDCFYMVLDVIMPPRKDGRVISKVIFILWVPDDAQIKTKMLYASSAANLRSKLDGIALTIEAHDISDVTYDAIKAVVAKEK